MRQVDTNIADHTNGEYWNLDGTISQTCGESELVFTFYELDVKLMTSGLRSSRHKFRITRRLDPFFWSEVCLRLYKKQQQQEIDASTARCRSMTRLPDEHEENSVSPFVKTKSVLFSISQNSHVKNIQLLAASHS